MTIVQGKGGNQALGAREVGPVIGAFALSIALTVIGYRLVVDATAAVIYGADERIPAADNGAWLWAGFWGFMNGLLAYSAYHAGYLRAGNIVKVVAAGIYALDVSFLLVLALRSGEVNLGFTAVVVLVAVLIGLLAWRRPVLGGSVLVVLGALLAFGVLFVSAWSEECGGQEARFVCQSSSYPPADGLLFHDELFLIVSLGLVPLLSGLLFVASRLFVASKIRRERRAVRPRRF